MATPQLVVGVTIGRLKIVERHSAKRIVCECQLCMSKVITSWPAKTASKSCNGCAKKRVRDSVGTVVNGRKIIGYTQDGVRTILECTRCGEAREESPKAAEKHECRACIQLERKSTYIGRKFGHLLATKVNHITKEWKVYVDCVCDCGKQKTVLNTHLKMGKIKTCGKGCTFRRGVHHAHFTGVAQLSGSLFGSYRMKAASRGIQFEITKEEALGQLEKQEFKCALTGNTITLGGVLAKTKGNTASLDRIDSNKGYTKDNIQWVHKDINFMKNAYDQDYFINMCKHVVNYQKRKEKKCKTQRAA